MPDIFQRLAAPLPPNKVSWRVGQVTKNDPHKASALCYIDARDVMERLDEVLTPAGWSDSYCETVKGRLICTISIKVGDQWISKSDGAGDTAVEGEKGAISDSFKRAAVKWGIGRYLYDIPIQWVAINQYKQIEPSEKAKLARALPGSRVADDDHADTGQEASPRAATGAQKPSNVTNLPPKRNEKFFARESYEIKPVSLDENRADWVKWSDWIASMAAECLTKAELVKLDVDNGRHFQNCQLDNAAAYTLARAAITDRHHFLETTARISSAG